MGHHFISYSRVDAEDFAVRIVSSLTAGSPPHRVWLDQRELKPGLDWDEQIGEAIKTCDSLLFVMTRDGVKPDSVCKREWTLALRYNKPVIPLRLEVDAELPFRLEPRQFIDFSRDFELALARLRAHLLWFTEPEGVLQTLHDRLAGTLRALPRAPESDRPRLMKEIADLERQIERQQRIVDDPHATAPLSADDWREEPPLAPAPPVPAPAPPLAPAKTWEPAVVERAKRDLALYIGPMARVIVDRAAPRTSSLGELYEILAAEIGSTGDRERFLASRPR
jgi:hypothetical protein